MNLYHYCPTEAFHSIITSKEIWLTSLSLSNDSMEGQLVRHVLTEMAKEDGLDEDHIARLQEIASQLNNFYDGLGFCLSEKKDLLSQWRGYANNAYGVSIGFFKKYLDQLANSYRDTDIPKILLKKVIYNIGFQKKALKETYEKIKGHIRRGAFDPPKMMSLYDEEIAKENDEKNFQFLFLLVSFAFVIDELFVLKSKAFQEEHEWRIISLLSKEKNVESSFQVSLDKIKPYRAFKLKNLGIRPIEEVVLGPKNTTPIHVMESFLEQNGFKDVKVIKSKASYR